MRLAHKVALITGAGSGIGRGIARMFAATRAATPPITLTTDRYLIVAEIGSLGDDQVFTLSARP